MGIATQDSHWSAKVLKSIVFCNFNDFSSVFSSATTGLENHDATNNGTDVKYK